MAIINIEYDTKTKKMNAKMDGKKIDDVHSVNTYHRGEGNHAMSITKQKHNKDDDTSEHHTIYASETPEEMKEIFKTIPGIIDSTEIGFKLGEYLGVK